MYNIKLYTAYITEQTELIFMQDSTNSYDYYDYDSNPNPASGDSHGTACAGEIGMVRSNGVCGVGVAYDSKIAGDLYCN